MNRLLWVLYTVPFLLTVLAADGVPTAADGRSLPTVHVDLLGLCDECESYPAQPADPGFTSTSPMACPADGRVLIDGGVLQFSPPHLPLRLASAGLQPRQEGSAGGQASEQAVEAPSPSPGAEPKGGQRQTIPLGMTPQGQAAKERARQGNTVGTDKATVAPDTTPARGKSLDPVH